MDWLKERTGMMDDVTLFQAFEEYEELDRTGLLKCGIARSIESEYRDKYSITGPVLETVRKAILYEMALRYYEQK